MTLGLLAGGAERLVEPRCVLCGLHSPFISCCCHPGPAWQRLQHRFIHGFPQEVYLELKSDPSQSPALPSADPAQLLQSG